MLQAIEKINASLSSAIWSAPMLILIVGTGILLSIRLNFFHVRNAKRIFKETVGKILKKESSAKSSGKNSISQYQALCTALAATIGTGNIAGVATAVSIGGPGAVCWMWISAFFGMMTIYSENVLGIYYRKKGTRDFWRGGAMYYLENGVGRKRGLGRFGKLLAILFSVFCIVASFGIGNMTQLNSITSAMNSSFGLEPLKVGAISAILAAFVILGGILRIGKTAEKLVPLMALFYIIASLGICIMNYDKIPLMLKSILRGAFDFKAVIGGGGGLAIKKAVTIGFKRGIFSNEAGLGSSVAVHASSNVREPAEQGMWAIFEVFVDTFVVCTLTAFVLLSSSADASMYKELKSAPPKGIYINISDSGSQMLINNTANAPLLTDGQGRFIKGEYGGFTYTNIMKSEDNYKKGGTVRLSRVDGVPLVTYAFKQHYGKWAEALLAIAILLFAFSTVLGWSYYGVKAWEYLFGERSTIIYKILFIVFMVVGSVIKLSLVWEISDTLNAMMAIPNLIGVIILSGEVKSITKNYIDRKIKGKSIAPMHSAY